MIDRLILAALVHVALVVPTFALDCTNGTQGDLNNCAERNFVQADEGLNARYKKIVECLKDDAKPLVEAQRAWIKFRDAECKFQGSASEGGSIQPMAIAGCLKAVTEERAKELDYYLTCEEGDFSCPTSNCGFPKPGKPK